jgi:hypothetical protein
MKAPNASCILRIIVDIAPCCMTYNCACVSCVTGLRPPIWLTLMKDYCLAMSKHLINHVFVGLETSNSDIPLVQLLSATE